ncbi:MAG: 7-carboxy-7-deazaguanine synthase QueE [Syntrophomonadaceae bacterium]|nr:7-carboxy-7-deazaguanine synthase QueE [Syntrophomonadaceae bacterium]
MKADLHEIMCTIQGEGALVGTRQVFIRFKGCNLRCSYCDTEESFINSKNCLVYKETGKNESKEIHPNPLTIDELGRIVKGIDANYISLTGGEPLLHAEFMAEFIKSLKGNNYKFLLETNGTLPEKLSQVIHYLDYVSMDIKLPSTIGKDFLPIHEEFLFIAQQKPCYIKIVITPDYIKEEFIEAIHMVKRINPNITVFIQPVTPRDKESKVDIFECIALQEYSLKIINDVRILPQIHPWLGLI